MTYLREKSLQFNKAKKLKDMTTKDVWSFVYALFKGLKKHVLASVQWLVLTFVPSSPWCVYRVNKPWVTCEGRRRVYKF